MKRKRKPIPSRLSTPINDALWNQAQWKGVFYQVSPMKGYTPRMGLIFRSAQAAKSIFQQWLLNYGGVDDGNMIRVSMVEGDIPGEPSGYSVLIGSDPESAHLEVSELTDDPHSPFMGSTRVHRMETPGVSPNLTRFKEAFGREGEYVLFPVVCRVDNPVSESQFTPFPDLAIKKTVVHFRNIGEIGENDIDRAVLMRPR
jgi:hypothetical protein